MYDIIGDIHGQATLLKKLLKDLGYAKINGKIAHPERKVVFVGDFVNRGPEIRETLQIVRQMVESGSAYAILGNHEINVLLYYVKDENKVRLLKSLGKRFASVALTIQEFKNYKEEWKDYRKWLRTLPLFLELDGIRIVHACWTDKNIEILKNELPEGKIPGSVIRNLLIDSHSPLSQSILQTSRGIHLVLPPDLRILDHRKRAHRFFRIKWWQLPIGLTFNEWSFESKSRFPNYTIPPQIIPDIEIYPKDAPLVFFGHYCRWKGPYVVTDNVCCVDTCVASRKILAAYRWSGEAKLNTENLVFAKIKN